MSRPLGAITLVIHGAAAAVAILLAVLLPYLDLGGGRIALGGGGAPLIPILAICAAVLGLSALLILYRAIPIFFRLPPYLCWLLVLTALIGAASLIGFWYGLLLEGEFRAWEYTVTGQVALYLLGLISLAALLVVAFRVDERPSLSGALERAAGRTPWLAPLMVFAGSALLSIFLLEGMPHNKDETIYLIQARMYWDGYLTLPAPLYPELWLSQDMMTTQAGHFGRFPVGWPLILGLFDKLTIAWLANPLLAGLLVWLTHRLVRTVVGPEAATLTAWILAATPWLYFQGASFYGHIASACWLVLFAHFFLAMIERRTVGVALLCGLALSGAFLTRPQDTLFFAIPGALWGLYLLIREPRALLLPGIAVIVAAIPGVAIYLAFNNYLMGDPFTSPYGDNSANVLLGQAPASIVEYIVWIHQAWVTLSAAWFAYAVPLAIPVVIGIGAGWHLMGRGRFLLWSGADFFLGYGLFIFVWRAWIDPRWLFPLLPVLALCLTAAVMSAARWRAEGGPRRQLGNGFAAACVAGLLICWVVAVPARLVELGMTPPGNLDGRLTEAAERAGLENAVVALSLNAYDPGTLDKSYKWMPGGFWIMETPFEDSPVIYVEAIPEWERKARESWPDRTLYTVSPEPGRFDFIEAPPAHSQ